GRHALVPPRVRRVARPRSGGCCVPVRADASPRLRRGLRPGSAGCPGQVSSRAPYTAASVSRSSCASSSISGTAGRRAAVAPGSFGGGGGGGAGSTGSTGSAGSAGCAPLALVSGPGRRLAVQYSRLQRRVQLGGRHLRRRRRQPELVQLLPAFPEDRKSVV